MDGLDWMDGWWRGLTHNKSIKVKKDLPKESSEISYNVNSPFLVRAHE